MATIASREYDLLLKGGRLIDTSQGLDSVQDIAVEGGHIRRIEPNIPENEARRAISVDGKIVTPGLIDLHVHILHGIEAINNSIDPDRIGVYAGVTTVVDAGSAGCDIFNALPSYIIPQAHTEVLAFLNLGRTGLVTVPDIFSEHAISVDTTLRVVEQHKELVQGIKIRMVSPVWDILGMKLARTAKEVAGELGTRVMVHIGDAARRADPNLGRELFPMLGQADIVTHVYTPNPGTVLDANGKLFPEAKELKAKGVWLDTAHGQFNFSFDVARRAIDQGLVPDCISTDMTAWGQRNGVHSLTEEMTRYLALGFSLEEVIAMASTNPARAIGQEHRLGSLAVGRQADISVLEIKEGDWIVYDNQGLRPGGLGSFEPTGSVKDGVSLRTDRAIVPVMAIKRGGVFMADWGPRPWGWEPDRAMA
ncbi:MAG: amidohydrolase family protein [Dehalococcoidia bacterium]